MGKFNQIDADDLLVRCHRCCCICHRYCGVKIELDHIIPQAETRPATMTSRTLFQPALSVMLKSTVTTTSIPGGRKFRPEELRKHREQWLTLCKQDPGILVGRSTRDSEVGPLQALIDELEFNVTAATQISGYGGCLFLVDQFGRAVREGSISTLQDSLKRSILDAYSSMSKVDLQITGAMAHMHGTEGRGRDLANAIEQMKATDSKIKQAKLALLKYRYEK